MKNILLIIHKLSNGGAEKAITLLANTLKENYNVTMVVFDNSIKEYIPEVNVIDLGLPANTKFIKKFYNSIYRIKKVKQIKKELNIDCSISYITGPNLVNCLTKNKEKVIISIRNMQSKLKPSFFKKLANQISLMKADKIVLVSKMVGEDIKKTYKFNHEKLIPIYNMVNLELIQNFKNEKLENNELYDIKSNNAKFKNNELNDLKLNNNEYNKEKLDKNEYNKKQIQNFESEELKVITIGRIIPQKGQWHLIKAFKKVVRKYKNAKLIILGRGELKKDFENLIKKLDLENNVMLVDFQINPYKYLANSNLFVSTSLYEGMPNVILEAMACDLPIIATDCEGGTKEILNPNNSNFEPVKNIEESEYGILIPRLDEKYDVTEKITEEENRLADVIIDILSDHKKRDFYAQKSKERIKDFEKEIIIQKWIKLIEE